MLGVSIADAYSSGQSNQDNTMIRTSIMQVIEPDNFTKLQQYQAVCIYRGEATIFMPVYHEHYPVFLIAHNIQQWENMRNTLE
jgi:hypothetical protein